MTEKRTGRMLLEVAALIAAVALLYVFLDSHAQSAAPPEPVTAVRESAYVPITGGYEKITSLDTVQTLTVPSKARRCLLYVEDDYVRWNDDGTDPDESTQIGGYLSAGTYFPYAGDLTAIELKGTASTIVHVWYYGP